MSRFLFGWLFVYNILDVCMFGKRQAVAVELFPPAPVYKYFQDLIDTFVFFNHFLILTSTLDGTSRLNEACHLFEDLKRPL